MTNRYTPATKLWERGEKQAAIAELRRQLAARATLTEHELTTVYGLLGGYLDDVGESDESVDFNRILVARVPRSDLASVQLFHSLNRSGRPMDAYRELERFLRLNPPRRKPSLHYIDLLHEVSVEESPGTAKPAARLILGNFLEFLAAADGNAGNDPDPA